MNENEIGAYILCKMGEQKISLHLGEKVSGRHAYPQTYPLKNTREVRYFAFLEKRFSYYVAQYVIFAKY